jgi:hypothetical protein
VIAIAVQRLDVLRLAVAVVDREALRAGGSVDS